MKKTGKVKAAVAGVAVVATVAAGTIGGGSPAPAPSSAAWTDTAPGSVAWSDAVTDLQNAVNSLMSVSAAHGVELPDNPGINDLVDGLDGVAPVDGYTTYATVSSTGAVSKGDPVRYPLEPDTAVRGSRSTGLGDGNTILAVASGAEDWTNSTLSKPAKPMNTNSAYIYTANGYTYLRGMDKNGNLGAVKLCAGAATSADVYCTYDGHILVAYAEGGAGVLQVYKADRQGYGVYLSDILTYTWTAAGGPDNIRLAYDAMDSRVSILCTVADEAGTRHGAVYDLVLGVNLDDILSDVAAELTADAWPALRGLSPDVGAKGWDICYGDYDHVMVTCPTTTGRQALIWTDRDEAGATEVKGYVLSKVKGGVDAALSIVPCEDGPETLMLARTVRDNGVNKVYMELLWRRASDGKPAIRCSGYVLGSDSAGEIDQLRICNDLYMPTYTSQPGAYLVSWVTDGGLYAATVEFSKDGAGRGSPAVKVTDTSGVGAIMERDRNTAKVVYADGNVSEGYVNLRRKVSRCEAVEADGYALADAQAGEGVQFMRTKTW